MKKRKMSAAEAEALDYTIDHSAAGCWYAYKGLRFSPDNQGVEIETEDETHWRRKAERLQKKLKRLELDSSEPRCGRCGELCDYCHGARLKKKS